MDGLFFAVLTQEATDCLRSLCFMYKLKWFYTQNLSINSKLTRRNPPWWFSAARERGGLHADQQLHDRFIFYGTLYVCTKGNPPPPLCCFTLGQVGGQPRYAPFHLCIMFASESLLRFGIYLFPSLTQNLLNEFRVRWFMVFRAATNSIFIIS